MNRDNAKKLSDMYEAIRPSEALLRQTEALMRTAPQKPRPVSKSRAMVLRAAATAACLVLICSAAFVYILHASPSDYTGEPGPGLASAPAEREIRLIAQPMSLESVSDTPSLDELIAQLDVAAMNTCGANAGELIVKGVCTEVNEYLPSDPDKAGFVSVILSNLEITDVLFSRNTPHDYADGDKITAVQFRYDVALPALPDPAGETEYLLCLSAVHDGNVYEENGSDVLVYSAWVLNSFYPQQSAN